MEKFWYTLCQTLWVSRPTNATAVKYSAFRQTFPKFGQAYHAHYNWGHFQPHHCSQLHWKKNWAHPKDTTFSRIYKVEMQWRQKVLHAKSKKSFLSALQNTVSRFSWSRNLFSLAIPGLTFSQANVNFLSSFVDHRHGWVPFYQDSPHEETFDFGSKNDPTLTRHCAVRGPNFLFHFCNLYYLSLHPQRECMQKTDRTDSTETRSQRRAEGLIGSFRLWKHRTILHSVQYRTRVEAYTTEFSQTSIFIQSADRPHKRDRLPSRKEQLCPPPFFFSLNTPSSHWKLLMGCGRAKTTQGNTKFQKKKFFHKQLRDHYPL